MSSLSSKHTRCLEGMKMGKIHTRETVKLGDMQVLEDWVTIVEFVGFSYLRSIKGTEDTLSKSLF